MNAARRVRGVGQTDRQTHDNVWRIHDLVRRPFVRFPLEVHRRLRVGDGTVLLVPVVVFDHGRDAVRVHEDITTKKRRLRTLFAFHYNITNIISKDVAKELDYIELYSHINI